LTNVKQSFWWASSEHWWGNFSHWWGICPTS